MSDIKAIKGPPRDHPCVQCGKNPCDDDDACLKSWLEAKYPGLKVKGIRPSDVHDHTLVEVNWPEPIQSISTKINIDNPLPATWEVKHSTDNQVVLVVETDEEGQ